MLPAARQPLAETSPLVDGPSGKPTDLRTIFVLTFPVTLGWAIEFYDYGCYTALTGKDASRLLARGLLEEEKPGAPAREARSRSVNAA